MSSRYYNIDFNFKGKHFFPGSMKNLKFKPWKSEENSQSSKKRK